MPPTRIPQQWTEPAQRPITRAAAKVAALYAVYAAAWIIFSDTILSGLGLPEDLERIVNSSKGLAFVVVTALVLYAGLQVHLTRLSQAEAAIRTQDARIRQAYVDVLDAVTGGRLVLVTEEELGLLLGDSVGGTVEIDDPRGLSAARRRIEDAVRGIDPELADSMNLQSAVGEALNNALKHAGRGTYAVYVTDTAVQVRVDDSGSGIDFRTLPKATLIPGFSTTATMGLGFTLMLQLSERVLLATRPGRTTVVLEFERGVKRGDSDTIDLAELEALTGGG